MIKRGLLLVLLSILIVFPLVSSAVIINTQPVPVYNLGDVAVVKVTFKPVQTVTGNFQMDLLCGANSLNFYKNGMQVAAGTEKVIESSLVLIKDIVGENKGNCKIKAYFGADNAITNEFLISDLIKVESTLAKTESVPEETLIVKGTAVKENGKASNGYVELTLSLGNNTIATQKGIINNGAFTTNVTIPKATRSGDYVLKVTGYEEDASGQITNTGSSIHSVFVNQVPTTLEIVFDLRSNSTENQLFPGETLRIKAVLHDQTGEDIKSDVFLTIKNNKNKVIEQIELPTNEFLEYNIMYNEPSSIWKIVAFSNKLATETSFSILEKESADMKMENNTILITNTGNVPYNETVLVKIANKSLNINAYLKVDESKRWLITAPNGEYEVSLASEGNSIKTTAVLTGDVIDIREASEGLISLVRFPTVWIFILAVLGIMTFIVFRRGYQKAFFGYITSGIPKKTPLATSSGSYGIISRGKAEMVVSIKGEKQEVSMITLKLKNMAWIKNVKEGDSTTETLEKVNDLAENSKAAVYDNGENIFFIFAPTRTKTFRNENTALDIARKMKETLDHHNKMFRQKIEYGISINIGEIIAKQDSESFKFTGMGNFMNSSKKIATFADNDIFMSEKMADKVKTTVKTEKHEREGTKVYSIKEVRDTEKHQKFLKGFMKRQGAD